MQFNISFDQAKSPDLASLTAAEQQTVLDVANVAATIWSWYLTASNVTLDLALIVDNSLFSGNTLAQGGPAGFYATGAMLGSERVYDTNTAVELRTGQDRNGAAADLHVDLTVNAIRNLMTFKTDDAASVVSSRVDALSVFLHEIGHGLGFLSLEDNASSASVFDTFVQNGAFTGPNATAAAGSAVPLEATDPSHIAESGAFGADLMSPVASRGTNTHISAVDLAILKDIGVPLREATGGADVMHALYGVSLYLGAGDDTGFAVGGGSTIYGEDGNDLLYGGRSADRLYGGMGDDVLEAGGGNDILDGGSGNDTARYSGLPSNYQILALADGSFQVKDLRAGSPDGTDVLIDLERLQWSDGSISALLQSGPVLTTANITAARNQVLDLSSLFSASVASGHAITRYQLWDDTRDAASGHFTVNGVTQPAGALIEITAAQLSQTKFVAGRVSDTLEIRAFDGELWSAGDAAAWSPFTVSVSNGKPVVTAASINVRLGQTVALSSLFSVSDPDGDAITRYQLWDSTGDAASGHFTINGVAQAAGSIIEITGAQLGQVQFAAGTVADKLQIRAFDGALWSAADTAVWSAFTVTPRNSAPLVVTGNVTAERGQLVALSSLFSVSDSDGDAITRYQLWDSTRDAASGYFIVNGVARAAGAVVDITAAQLSQAGFVAGSIGDALQIRAFDGTDWSAATTTTWSPFTLSVTGAAPSVVTADVTRSHFQTIALSTLFSVSDADGDPITKYQLWDSTRDPASGHFVVNGVTQAAGSVIEITAAQLSQTSFVTGIIGDALQIRAFDGKAWSAGTAADWSPFTVSVPDTAPMVVTGNIAHPHLQTIALSSLISVSDLEGDTITKYQLWDSTRDPASGHFVVAGVAQAAGSVIEITAAQLAQTSFVTGAIGDMLQVRAFDGALWSAGESAAWAPFAIQISANHLPVLTTSAVSAHANQTLSLASLFSVSDADGDSIAQYQLWDSTRDPASGHFVVGGVPQAAATVIDISAAQLAQTSFVTGTAGDILQIRAFDGIGWSAATNVSWAPFHVAVT